MLKTEAAKIASSAWSSMSFYDVSWCSPQKSEVSDQAAVAHLDCKDTQKTIMDHLSKDKGALPISSSVFLRKVRVYLTLGFFASSQLGDISARRPPSAKSRPAPSTAISQVWAMARGPGCWAPGFGRW